MPNWCNNTVVLKHEDPTMIERARKAFTDARFLEEFIPVPKDLHIVSGSVGAKGSPEQIELEAQTMRNLSIYGYATWYDYCVNEWGTKWDVGGDDYNAPQDIPGGLMLSFDSAWSPPITAYEKLMELGFEIEAMYYEPGMAFAGVWDNGSDDYYDYSGLDSKGIAEQLPARLDEAFWISESVAEWEEDNKEEENEDQ